MTLSPADPALTGRRLRRSLAFQRLPNGQLNPHLIPTFRARMRDVVRSVITVQGNVRTTVEVEDDPQRGTRLTFTLTAQMAAPEDLTPWSNEWNERILRSDKLKAADLTLTDRAGLLEHPEDWPLTLKVYPGGAVTMDWSCHGGRGSAELKVTAWVVLPHPQTPWVRDAAFLGPSGLGSDDVLALAGHARWPLRDGLVFLQENRLIIVDLTRLIMVWGATGANGLRKRVYWLGHSDPAQVWPLLEAAQCPQNSCRDLASLAERLGLPRDAGAVELVHAHLSQEEALALMSPVQQAVLERVVPALSSFLKVNFGLTVADKQEAGFVREGATTLQFKRVFEKAQWGHALTLELNQIPHSGDVQIALRMGSETHRPDPFRESMMARHEAFRLMGSPEELVLSSPEGAAAYADALLKTWQDDVLDRFLTTFLDLTI